MTGKLPVICYWVMYRLAEPPNLLIQKNADKVDEPYEGSAEEQDDGNNDSEGVSCNQALCQAVNGPYDVEYGDAENELYDQGKPIECFDKIFHLNPPKNVLASRHFHYTTFFLKLQYNFYVFVKNAKKRRGEASFSPHWVISRRSCRS